MITPTASRRASIASDTFDHSVQGGSPVSGGSEAGQPDGFDPESFTLEVTTLRSMVDPDALGQGKAFTSFEAFLRAVAQAPNPAQFAADNSALFLDFEENVQQEGGVVTTPADTKDFAQRCVVVATRIDRVIESARRGDDAEAVEVLVNLAFAGEAFPEASAQARGLIRDGYCQKPHLGLTRDMVSQSLAQFVNERLPVPHRDPSAPVGPAHCEGNLLSDPELVVLAGLSEAGKAVPGLDTRCAEWLGRQRGLNRWGQGGQTPDFMNPTRFVDAEEISSSLAMAAGSLAASVLWFLSPEPDSPAGFTQLDADNLGQTLDDLAKLASNGQPAVTCIHADNHWVTLIATRERVDGQTADLVRFIVFDSNAEDADQTSVGARLANAITHLSTNRTVNLIQYPLQANGRAGNACGPLCVEAIRDAFEVADGAGRQCFHDDIDDALRAFAEGFARKDLAQENRDAWMHVARARMIQATYEAAAPGFWRSQRDPEPADDADVDEA